MDGSRYRINRSERPRSILKYVMLTAIDFGVANVHRG